jgi:hypothetical protein
MGDAVGSKQMGDSLVINLESEDGSERLAQGMRLLNKNLRAAGFNVSRSHDTNAETQKDFESKSDPVTLYTVAITFMTSGAAVALINALRATFAASHGFRLKAKVVLPGKTIEVSAETLEGKTGELTEGLAGKASNGRREKAS